MPIFRILRTTVSEFLEDGCARMAAALSYYVVFALPPLLVLLLVLLGALIDTDVASRLIQDQFAALAGRGVADQIAGVVEGARDPGIGRGPAALLGIGALLFGATGAFVELQQALNRVWDVKPDPEQGGVKRFIVKRMLSLGMVLAIGFLLLVSLVLSAVITAFDDLFASYLPASWSGAALRVVNLIVSIGVFTLLFAAMFRLLPDARIRWRQVWVGALVTTLLFVVGKALIGVYLGNSEPGQAYGAASSLAVLLVWIYYSSMIVLLGAEFTQVWAERGGRVVEPEPGAVRIEPARRERARD
jgi:membrane protein